MKKISDTQTGLEVPVPSQNKDKDINPTAIAKWCQKLPISDLGRSAKMIFDLVEKLNDIKMEAEERFKILEVLKFSASLICQQLRKKYILHNAHITEEKYEIAQIGNVIQTNLALGYKLVLKDTDNSNKKSLAKIIHRILSLYDKIILRTYSLYAQIDSILWKEIFILLETAYNNKVENLTIFNAKSEHSVGTSTVAQAAKNLIVFSLTDPYQWRQREQMKLYSNILKILPLVTIYPQNNDNPSEESYFYLNHEGNKPKHVKLATNKQELGFIIDLSKLINNLKEIRSKQCNLNNLGLRDFRSSKLNCLELNKLINIWGDNATIRNNSRFEQSGSAQVVLGLHASHYFMWNQVKFDSNHFNEYIEEYNRTPDKEDKSQEPDNDDSIVMGADKENDIELELDDDDDINNDSDENSNTTQESEQHKDTKHVHDYDKSNDYKIAEYSLELNNQNVGSSTDNNITTQQQNEEDLDSENNISLDEPEINNSSSISEEELESIVLGESTQDNNNKDDEYNWKSCDIIDISPNGMKLKVAVDNFSDVHIGEILSLRLSFNSDKNIWSVGVIRWIKYIDKDFYHIGLQILAPNAMPVALQVIRDKKIIGRYLKAILLPAIEGLQDEPTIITPILPFKAYDKISLIYLDSMEKVEGNLSNVVGAASGFKQFKFVAKGSDRTLNKNPISEQGTTKDNNKESDMEIDANSIWSRL